MCARIQLAVSCLLWTFTLSALGTAAAPLLDNEREGERSVLGIIPMSTDRAAEGGEGRAKCYHIRGVPKSGTTWLNMLLEECRKLHCRAPKERVSPSPICDSGRCPDASQSKHSMLLDEVKSTGGKNVFIFRDSRDVVVSHYHWSRHGHSSIASFVRDPKFGIYHVVAEQNRSLEVMDQLRKFQYTQVCYEDLTADTANVVERLAAFIGLKLTPADISAAIEASSFESMRKREEAGKLMLKIHPHSDKTLKKAAERGEGGKDMFGVMTRSGTVGGYSEELDGDSVKFVESVMRERLDKRLVEQYLSPKLTRAD